MKALEEAKNSLSELCASLNKQLLEVELIKTQLKELNALKAELSDLKAQAEESGFKNRQNRIAGFPVFLQIRICPDF